MQKVVIAGGGIMGAATALALKSQGFAGDVIVYEKDPSYQFASTTLSAASIRQQFSTPQNIALSQYGLEFILKHKEECGFKENGYIYLASQGEILRQNYEVQRANGADVVWLTPQDISARFPHISVEGLSAGVWGQTGEGWFDAASLLQIVTREGKALGVKFVKGEVLGYKTSGHRVTHIQLDNETVACDFFVNSMGAGAGAFMAKHNVELPVSPRKRTVFVVKPKEPMPYLPLIIDPSGLWCRPEGDLMLVGGGEGDEIQEDFNPDYHLFEEKLWEALANRIPSLENLKLIRAWAGHYDYNLLDQNAIIGAHHNLENLYFINGFSGHGLQHGLGAGRGLAELIIKGAYQTLDLSIFSYNRILDNKPIVELNVI
jgi:glycine/D-amino acid oxidase-like deaminating enzyme